MKEIIIELSNTNIYLILLTNSYKSYLSFITNYYTGFIIIAIINLNILSFMMIDLINNRWIWILFKNFANRLKKNKNNFE